jgi:rhamnopyranosyl-N-acetylglucosaminyl-diphospho-decaprenol beta-1,3/1,4-galactofuranosyltransferase
VAAGHAIPKVAAVVVTRNRRELLRESLTALKDQTRPVDRIVVVDNASSDGTRDMLRHEFAEVLVVVLAVNQGATGGFYEGISTGCAEGADWLWLLDDDSFPRPTALEELLDALDRLEGRALPALLSSRVEWLDGEPHPINMPTVRRRDPELLVDAARNGLLPLRATTWVSLLLARGAVDEGMPLRHFFYQADDIEYTARILRRATGYFVPDSVVEHRTTSKEAWIEDERRFYYHARNNVFMLRGDAWAPWEKPALGWALARSAVEYLRANRFTPSSAWTVLRALAAGLGSSAR